MVKKCLDNIKIYQQILFTDLPTLFLGGMKPETILAKIELQCLIDVREKQLSPIKFKHINEKKNPDLSARLYYYTHT